MRINSIISSNYQSANYNADKRSNVSFGDLRYIIEQGLIHSIAGNKYLLDAIKNSPVLKELGETYDFNVIIKCWEHYNYPSMRPDCHIKLKVVPTRITGTTKIGKLYSKSRESIKAWWRDTTQYYNFYSETHISDAPSKKPLPYSIVVRRCTSYSPEASVADLFSLASKLNDIEHWNWQFDEGRRQYGRYCNYAKVHKRYIR